MCQIGVAAMSIIEVLRVVSFAFAFLSVFGKDEILQSNNHQHRSSGARDLPKGKLFF